ncbi:serine/threonine-protein phosphatase 5 [Dorcoceras hygrometricum]|uniref:Serine/threonine-protein phosphatase 5 n=1 Tax=Dorcoceras hygrometricum TaxID=472368 RepID=A0A2Z7D9S0_9LAMI|nr:serine/threonine-protein phosphatase 5 [Dorcoceras hygrometricum]
MDTFLQISFRRTLNKSTEMASSFTSTALQVNFDSVLGITDNAEMELEQFFDTALVQDNDITSVFSGKNIAITEDRFAGVFGLPTEGLVDISEVPKDLVIKVNWIKILFGVLKEMVDKTLKRAKGFAAQICVLLKGDPPVTLGDATNFPPLKILSAKTVQTYVATNETIDARGKSDDSGVVKVASVKKKSVHKKKSAPTDDEPVVVVDEKAVSKKRPVTEADVPRLATVRSELLDFRAQAQENHLNLSTQLGFLVDYINRGGDAKKGEGGSSRPQPPPDDQNRPSEGSASRGSGSGGSSRRDDRRDPSKKRRSSSGVDRVLAVNLMDLMDLTREMLNGGLNLIEETGRCSSWNSKGMPKLVEQRKFKLEQEHCDVLSMQMDSDLVIYRTILVRTFQVNSAHMVKVEKPAEPFNDEGRKVQQCQKTFQQLKTLCPTGKSARKAIKSGAQAEQGCESDGTRRECCASAKQKTEKCTIHSGARRKFAHSVAAGVHAGSVLMCELKH